MKKLLILCSIVFVVLAMSACSNNNHATLKVPKLVKVVIKTQPEQVKPNKEVTVQAVVTQGKDKVADAHEVEFEIWRIDQEKHKIFKAKNDGGGIYSVKYTFPGDGTYDVIAHVTARDMHTMPTKEFIVGKPTPSESAHHDDEHEHVVTVKLAQNSFKAGAKSTIQVNVVHNHAPLTKATVEFEIWQDHAPKHNYIDAKEIGNGTYSAETTFKNVGKYKMRIHVENKELHDHQVVDVNVTK